MIGKRVSCSYYLSSFTNDDLITFLPSSNMMVRLALFPSAISVIVPSPKTLCLILSPMSNVAIYLFLLIYPQTTRMANMMMTSMCTGMPNKYYLDCVESGLLKCSSNRKIISSLIDLVAAIRVPFILMDTSVVNDDGSIILNVSDNP